MSKFCYTAVITWQDIPITHTYTHTHTHTHTVSAPHQHELRDTGDTVIIQSMLVTKADSVCVGVGLCYISQGEGSV